MKKPLFVLLALAGAVLGAQPQPLTPAQTLERRGIGELDLSRDGSRLAFTVTEPVKGNARQRNIWLLEIASGEVRQLTFSAKNDSSPKWAPDGQSLAFLSDRDGADQIYRLSMRGGEAEKITERKGRRRASRRPPDARHLAFRRAEPKGEGEGAGEKEREGGGGGEKGVGGGRMWDVEEAEETDSDLDSHV